MLAKHIGASIFATVGSYEKKSLLVEKYNIPAEHIFSSRDTSFAQDVLAATDRRGVDVVLNTLAVSLLQAGFDALAPFGHFLELGKGDVARNSCLEMRNFARHASFSSIDIPAMLQLRVDDVSRILAEVARLASDGVVKPITPLTNYPISETKEAFQLVQSGKHSGKVLLSINPEESVALLPQQPKARLTAHASYLLVGSIGQSMAVWMIEHGAKNLILLAHQGETVDHMPDFVEQIQEAGCRVKAISCDISSILELGGALEACQQEGFPPVRGILHGTQDLQKDSILEHMSYDDYNSAIQPKVAGTWNLHSRFPNTDDLDFFILLSANTGILGNAGQSHHSAGATYQDALARWRVSQGLPCVSMDLARIKSVATEEDTAKLASMRTRMAKLGHMWLDEHVIEDLVETA
ncbi:MAG: hypothetical protein Q9183_007000, partial [Haloplaca sp. 2 TL-2023]